jgi:subtilisin family serine protease
LFFAGIFLVQSLGGIWIPACGADKYIQLRNEHIRTSVPNPTGPGGRVTSPNPNRPDSGLWLIQFVGAIDPAWRDLLAAQGVELSWYVPEDTFVARCHQTNLESVRALPFVRWMGPFRPGHKIHASLLPNANGKPGTGGPEARPWVSILMAADATPAELADAGADLDPTDQTSSSRTRFGTVLRGRLAPGRLAKLAASPSVLWIEPGGRMKMFDQASASLIGGPGTNHATATQQLGFDGRGVTVAVADSGLYLGDTNTMHPDLFGRVRRLLAYGGLTNAMDENGHGTHIAGIIAGNGARGTEDENGNLFGLGVAPSAQLVIQRIFDGAGYYHPPSSYTALASDAVASGADIGSNSWGEDTEGRYNTTAMEFDALTRDAQTNTPGFQPYLLVFSAGNAGPVPLTIASPAVAKNVIAAGASQSSRSNFATFVQGPGVMADFSSRGPCEDGRIKPDLVAPGTWIASLRAPGADLSWLIIDEDYTFMGGTSQAAPHVAGAAAVALQYLRQAAGISNPSPALVKAALIHSASGLNPEPGAAPSPNMSEGWGRPDLTEFIGASAPSHEYINQTVLLTNGQVFERRVIVAGTNEPLRITLAYTDVPGFPAALPALVNNLDLELLTPNGHLYRGNQLDHGNSIPDAPSADAVNNVESITVHAPPVGEYRVRVRATRVVLDARRDTANIDQDFALVMCGNFPAPGSSVVFMDRSAYTAPGRINLKVFDLDNSIVHPVTVRVTSGADQAVKLVLLASVDGNTWTGSVATVQGVASGVQVQVADGQWIRADYVEDNVTNTAFALGDLTEPNITDLLVTNRQGQVVVSWQTFEEATSSVRYGTSLGNLDQLLESQLLTTSHELRVPGLQIGQHYYFAASSTDAAGNTATSLQEFTPQAGPAVLLVDAYTYAVGDMFVLPSTYTDALDQTGVSYTRWDPVDHFDELPTYADLRPYRIVMWRINDSHFQPSDVIPPAQQLAIQQYLDGGGAFFMSSMEILSRLLNEGSADFVTNVLHVQRFVRNPDGFCQTCDENFQVPQVQGIDYDPLGDGLQLDLSYDGYASASPDPGGPDFADTFGVTTNATAFLLEPVSGRVCGMRFPRTGEDNAGRVVFVSFPLDAIAETGSSSNRAVFLGRVFQFLAPGLNGIGTVAMNRSQYHTPDLVNIELADSDLAGQGAVSISVHSSTRPNPIPVMLRETPQLGVFRGSVQLVFTNPPPPSGQLGVVDGDVIYAVYNDSTRPVPAKAFAVIDRVPPVIYGLTNVPGYSEATILWETDEPTDALVQFGESVFLGRTAYSSELDYSHQVTFSGLNPDRAYYYKIVSHDAAGNATTNNYLFNFDTRQPEPVENHVFWDMEDIVEVTNDWRVLNAPGTERTWELGLPNNNLVVGGHGDKPNAWATDLIPNMVSRIDTSLISPAIALDGGNLAHLQFWHSYGFSAPSPSVNESGRLLIVTNPLSPPMLIATYTGTARGYHVEDIDLTPFLGHTIFLIWNHQLASSIPELNLGWVIDDVCVMVTNVPTGVISISNNLAQGQAHLSGPAIRTAQGYTSTFNDLPPGTYRVTWTPVEFYLTPPDQTNTLDSGMSLSWTGVYSFTDANHNGMSDPWEQFHFGTNDPLRTRFTDTDQDGFTDLAEFLAGTDPKMATSSLRLAPPVVLPGNSGLQVQWPTVPDRIYLLESTANLRTWTAVGTWTKATANSMVRVVPSPPGTFFRVSVLP